MILLQLFFNGLIAGSIYALITTGFSLVYSTNRFVHFAHGSVAAVGAYALFFLFTVWQVPFTLAVMLTIMVSTLVGAGLFFLVYEPLMKRKSSSVILLIASLALAILLDNLLLIVFGAGVKTIPLFTISKGWEVWGAVITPLQIVIVGTSVVLLSLLWLGMYRTKFGAIVRAVADNPELARITGINTRRVQYTGFMVGSALAGVAGILVGLEQNVEPAMGFFLIIKGFTGAVIGGMTSIPGSVLGSYLLGLVENFGIWYLPSGYKDAIAFALLLAFLLIKPTGILGINKGIRH